MLIYGRFRSHPLRPVGSASKIKQLSRPSENRVQRMSKNILMESGPPPWGGHFMNRGRAVSKIFACATASRV